MANIAQKATKLALVGTSSHTTYNVRKYFDNPEWEIWGMNNLYNMFPDIRDYATRWFQLHSREYLDQRNMNIEALKSMKYPVYMHKHYKDIPASKPYPLKTILKEFGYYFTNSFAWMMALAIHEKVFKEIHLYGIDFGTETEYFQERPALEYYIGLARGKSIKVFIPQESDLLKTGILYGFEERGNYIQNLRLKIISYEKKKNEAHGALINAAYEHGVVRGKLLITDRSDELWEVYNKIDDEAMIRRNDASNRFQQWLGACDVLHMMLRTWMHKSDFNRLENIN